MNVFDMAKKNYKRGLWTVEMLNALVTKELLTEEEVQDITTEEE